MMSESRIPDIGDTLRADGDEWLATPRLKDHREVVGRQCVPSLSAANLHIGRTLADHSAVDDSVCAARIEVAAASMARTSMT